MITVDNTRAKLDEKSFFDLQPKIADILQELKKNPNAAWMELPCTINLEEIKTKAIWVRDNFDVLLVIGVGGSYLGTYAGLEFLKDDVNFNIEFLGLSFDTQPIERFVKKYSGKRVCVNVVSKSGTTLEVTTTLDLIKKQLPEIHILWTTSGEEATFTIPSGVGGRFSVLSAVGLFPFAVAGLDVDGIVKGACVEQENGYEHAIKYAISRFILNTTYNKDVEVFACFYENACGITQWWQQLFGESEGKNGRGIFPSPMIFTRDLHSMGQYIQQGKPILFETLLSFTNPDNKLNNAAFNSTVDAHSSAQTPVIIINAGKQNPESLGKLFYFFKMACAISAFLLGVNPFDQPGVELYKKNIIPNLLTTVG